MTEIAVAADAGLAARSGLRLPACLVIMDGLAYGSVGRGSAVDAARTPVLDALWRDAPHSFLSASGRAVGLPEGQMGNSEVGHLNIGAGRTVYQELTRIDKAIEDGSLFENPVLCQAIDAAIAVGGTVHLMGLLSDGGVHSHRNHLYALIDMAVDRGAKSVAIHCFLDGRDTPPQSGLGYVAELSDRINGIAQAGIATVSGRYYAMDRDNRWERVERAWRAIALGEGERFASACDAVSASYSAGVTDEFVMPSICGDMPLNDGDSMVFFNFRPDRAREITRAFVDPEFSAFQRPAVADAQFVCLTQYDPTIPALVAFSKCLPENVLADVIAQHGLRQLHIAETEKYAHVTFFLNGGSEPPKNGETRILVPSPKVATYDLQAAMSAIEVTDKLVEAIRADVSDVYIVNFANGDMVGHTGVLDATIIAVETVDECVGRVLSALAEKTGVALVTADHGNAEMMIGEDGVTPFTAHSTSDVPLIAVAFGVSALRDGILADVAPTLLDLIGIARPDEWTGSSLLVY